MFSLSLEYWGYNTAVIEDAEGLFPAMTCSNSSPCPTGKIPEEAKALSLLAPAAPPAVPAVPSLMPGAGLLPLPTSAPIQTVSLGLIDHTRVLNFQSTD